MPDDFDRLEEIFGSHPKGMGSASEKSVPKSEPKADRKAAPKPAPKPAGKQSAMGRLDEILYDPDKSGAEEEPPEERDYRPIRRSREGKTGCLGGLMYFIFVVSVSVILACVGWMAATDVLALNKTDAEAQVTLPDSAFTAEERTVENEDGSKTTETVQVADIGYVADVLKDAGVIQYKWLFRLFCTVSHADLKLDPGTYVLNTDYDYRALVKNMQTGSTSTATTELTFPEGWTMEQIFSRLEEEGVCDKDDLYAAAADYTYNYSFLGDTEPGDAARLEGFLFPDTYEFYIGMQASSAVNKFLENFYVKMTADMYNQAENLGLSMRQAVIVASMIEGEAANDEERPLIASVIYNRLAADMPLQIDATLQYALGEHKDVLTDADKNVDSPYNTYLHTGLPPGAICNPGLASIKAALQPSDTNYYYYALDTATKSHRFFATLDEFNQFVATQDYTAG